MINCCTKMWCASIGDAITWLKREVVPACLAWEASARLLRAGAKNVFGEEERGGRSVEGGGRK